MRPLLDTVMTPPRETVHRVSRRAVLLSVVAVVGVVALVNAAAALWLARTPRDLGAQVVQAKWSNVDVAAAQGDEPVDVLLVGDSSCNQGVLPALLTEGTPLRALNLCTIGFGTVADDAWLLADYIARVGAPKTVVVIHSWDVWPRDTSALRATLWTIPGGPPRWDSYAPELPLGAWERFVARWGAWMPLYTRAATLRQALRAPGAASVGSFTPDGFMEPPGVAGAVADRVAEQLRRTQAAPWSVSAWNEEAALALIALAEAHDVRVVFASGPVHEDLLNAPSFTGWMDEYTAWARALADEHPHVAAAAPFYEAIPREEMESADHTNRAGAEHFTRTLGERLREAGEHAAD